MRRHQQTGTVADMVRNIAILVGIVVVTSATVTAAWLAISTAVNGGEPVPHIDAENNVICYTYRNALSCMAYHDEGTHLEIVP